MDAPLNVHLPVHLPEVVKALGPLIRTWAFKMERLNRLVKVRLFPFPHGFSEVGRDPVTVTARCPFDGHDAAGSAHVLKTSCPLPLTALHTAPPPPRLSDLQDFIAHGNKQDVLFDVMKRVEEHAYTAFATNSTDIPSRYFCTGPACARFLTNVVRL